MEIFKKIMDSQLFWITIELFSIYLVKQLLLKILHAKIKEAASFYKVKRAVNTTAFIIALILLFYILSKSNESITTFLGLFSAGVALAMKDILLNIAGWIYIFIRQPFVVGDRVEIAGHKGDVIDQNLFKFRIIEVGNWVHADQSTGRIIHIPNAKIFTDPMASYTLGFDYIWEEIRVMVTFESDWRKTKSILIDILNDISEDLTEDLRKQIKNASKKYLIYYNNLTPIVYTQVVDSGVQFSLRFICEPKKRRILNEKIWEAILDAFEKEGNIDIAYPTMRRT